MNYKLSKKNKTLFGNEHNKKNPKHQPDNPQVSIVIPLLAKDRRGIPTSPHQGHQVVTGSIAVRKLTPKTVKQTPNEITLEATIIILSAIVKSLLPQGK